VLNVTTFKCLVNTLQLVRYSYACDIVQGQEYCDLEKHSILLESAGALCSCPAAQVYQKTSLLIFLDQLKMCLSEVAG